MVPAAQKDIVVSVIIPVYNAAGFVRHALESVSAQTYSKFEILAVIDPASSDNSEEVLRDYNDPRLKIHRAATPGVSAARNLALRMAQGRYAAFLDADDFWLPQKLERQLKYMIEGDLNFSATSFRRVNELVTRTGRLISVPRDISHKRLLKQNSLCCSSVMLDLKKVGPVEFEDIGCEDFALWLNITGRGLNGFGIPEDLVRYRVLSKSRGSSKFKTAKESWALVRKEADFIPAALGFAGFLARGAWKHCRF